MGLKTIIRKLIFPDTYSSEAFVSALRNKYHVDIGNNCIFWSPNHVNIDVQRPWMLHIGNDVRVTSGVTILCHDYSRSVFCDIEGMGNVGEAKTTWIGDNVFIGVNAIILMGTRIGNNSIVGAGAVASGSFPDGSVIAGNPAKVITTVEELYKKRKDDEVFAAKRMASEFKIRKGRFPTIEEMTNAFSWLYIPHDHDSVDKYEKLFKLNGVNKEILVKNFLASPRPVFESYEAFLSFCEESILNEKQ